MTLTQLEYVLALSRLGNFHRAAAHCFVTQPTLSMQIKKLEGELETILFDRSKKPIMPTESGRIVIKQAELILNEVKRIPESIEFLKGKVEGDLKLGIIPTISPYLVPFLVSQCQKRYPDLRLVIQEKTTEDCLNLLDKDEIDGAILATQEDPGKYTQHPFFEDTLWIYVHPRHELSKAHPPGPKDLKPKDLWLLEDGHCLRDEIISLCQMKSEIDEQNKSLRIQMGSLETVRYLVQNRFGYTLLPQIAVRQLATQERATYIRPFKKPFPSRSLNLTIRRRHLKEGALKAIQEILFSCQREFQ